MSDKIKINHHWVWPLLIVIVPFCTSCGNSSLVDTCESRFIDGAEYRSEVAASPFVEEGVMGIVRVKIWGYYGNGRGGEEPHRIRCVFQNKDLQSARISRGRW